MKLHILDAQFYLPTKARQAFKHMLLFQKISRVSPNFLSGNASILVFFLKLELGCKSTE